MITAEFSLAIDGSVIRPIPAYRKPPFTFQLIPGVGGTGTVYTTNDRVVSASSAWTLLDTDASGWVSGVASVGAAPAAVYAPITGYKIVANVAALTAKVTY